MTRFWPKKVYIAGKVTGLPTEIYLENFKTAKEFLEKFYEGVEIVNPVLIGGEEYSWEDNMKFCIAELMTCDTVVFIPGWQSSKGAMIEYDIAKKLNYNLGEIEYSLAENEISGVNEIE